MALKTWSTTAASNATVDSINFAENQAPSTVNDSARALMADVRTWYNDYEWRDWGHTVTYVSATTFSVPTDVTADYVANQPIRCTDATTLYGKVASSAYSAPNTTVTVTLDSGVLSASLTAVSLGQKPTGKPIDVSGVRDAVATTGTQTIAGAKTFSGNNTHSGTNTFSGANTFSVDQIINGIEVGRGAGNVATNTTFGDTALDTNTTGANNSAFGVNALTANTTGASNSAFGSNALSSNVSSTNNSAFGQAALANSSGGNNSAFGYFALNSVGAGARNTAAGMSSGSTMTTGSNNSFLGYNAQPSVVGVSNEITLGDANVATLRCQVTTITALSDARDKRDIETLPLGLDFIAALRPVQFTWARRDGTKEGAKEAGFIAQELDAVQQSFGAEDYLNLVYKSNPEKLEATPGNLLPVLVKAIQELKTELDEYKAEHP